MLLAGPRTVAELRSCLYDSLSSSVEVHVSNLRKRLSQDQMIVFQRGKYIFIGLTCDSDY